MKNVGLPLTLFFSLVTILCHEAAGNRLVRHDRIRPASPELVIITVENLNNGEGGECFSSEVAPVITGQKILSLNEDGVIEIQFSDLVVEDPDSAYPDGFVMTLTAGSNYTISSTTVIPAANYFGTLTVPVVVNDGTDNSEPFQLQIEVLAVNDVPEITGQASISGQESQSLTISLTQLIVSDPDDEYPDAFSLQLEPGENYTVSGSTITPTAGYHGTLSVGAIVNDGDANSNTFPLTVAITEVNDPPVITGQQPLEIPEDGQLTLQFTDLIVTDPDNSYPTGFSMIVSPGTNYTTTGTTIIPNENFNGVLTVPVVVNDGTNDSQPFNLSINIVSVNDAPVITGQQAISVGEDQTYTIGFTDLLVNDPDNAYPSGFSLTVFNGTNYSVNGFAITPLAGFNGTLSVPVQVGDGAASSNVFNLAITVQAQNDPPVIVGQNPVIIQEDTSYPVAFGDLIVTDEDNTYPNGFSLSVGSGENYSVSGNTITPAANFTGTLSVPVSVNDGQNSSNVFALQIQVSSANDAPVITGQVALSTLEEQAITLNLQHLTVSDPDSPFPTGFTLEVSAGANYTVSETTITPAMNFFGVLSIPVRVFDGINFSPSFNFQLTVNPVNDQPSFSPISNQQNFENSAPVQLTLTGISPGPGESDQQLTILATSGNTSVVPDPVINYTGGTTATLTYSLVPNVSGAVTITVIAIDNGPTGPPHQNTFTSQFQIQVIEVNQAPTINAISNVSIAEDAAEQAISLSGISAGPGETQAITVSASTNTPQLFEIFQVVYVSPESTGTLRIKPVADAVGTATVQIVVTDNGSATAPSDNSTTVSFTITILPVNDPPVFVSVPVNLAVLGESYQYIAQVSDKESSSLVFSSAEKPSWMIVENLGGNKARLSGVPNAAGQFPVRLSVNDGDQVVEQSFTLLVNTRPQVSSFQIVQQEDEATALAPYFQQSFSDADGNALQSVIISVLPLHGQLLLGDKVLTPEDTVPVSSFDVLKYIPELDFSGTDVFQWRAGDGYHFSSSAARADITIQPVNDAPSITLEMDTLQYEVNGNPQFITSLFDIYDPDSDSLSSGEIGFSLNYRPAYDLLSFTATANIRAVYDFQSGRITMSGRAPVSEYEAFVKSLQFFHLNTLDPLLEMKIVYFSVSDGLLTSEQKGRLIQLQYTFVELEIPTGFTPNGDGVNDQWVISRPTGLEELTQSVIRVFNEHGHEVFRTKGFGNFWDGTMNGNVLPAGPYFYTIDLNLRSKKTYRGVVTLLR